MRKQSVPWIGAPILAVRGGDSNGRACNLWSRISFRTTVAPSIQRPMRLDWRVDVISQNLPFYREARSLVRRPSRRYRTTLT